MMDINVLVIVYRRLDKAKLLFEVLAQIKPKRVFISSNAAANKGEESYVNEIREIWKNVTWDCDINYLYNNEHISDCSTSVTKAINWFFNHVDSGIILEDDCIPTPTFFTFCENMLKKYELDSSVMHISGTNLLAKTNPECQYFFSQISLPCWGWASWKRAWLNYTPNMNNWRANKDALFKTLNDRLFWERVLAINENQKIGWDLQWMIDIIINNGKVIIPSKNLVSNIGFDKYATLTKNKDSKFSNLQTDKLLLNDKIDLTNYNNDLERLVIKFILEL